MGNLSRIETVEFLEVFLKGLLEVGLIQPLQALTLSTTPNVSSASHRLCFQLLNGIAPQVAIPLMAPRFPSKVEALLINGFEQSNIDLVMRDVLLAHKDHIDIVELNSALDELLIHYSPLKNEQICIECWTAEIQKILRRSSTEQAAQVLISFENDHLVQKYISAKLVTVSESAVPAVYATLKQAFSELARPGTQNSLGIEVMSRSDKDFQITTKSHSVRASFVD